MASNFVQEGCQVTVTAPTGGVTSGVGVLIGDLFGVSLNTAIAGANCDIATDGVWDLAKTSAQAWAVGDKIYWDDANKKADNTATAGARHIGQATAAATNPSSVGRVRLNGNGAPRSLSAAVAPASKNTAGAVTYTAAELLGGIIVRDPNGAGRTDILPTAALLVAAVPGARVGDVIRTLIVNGADAAEAITISAGTGGAFDANQTASSQVIPQNASKTLTIRLTNVTASSEAYVAYL